MEENTSQRKTHDMEEETEGSRLRDPVEKECLRRELRLVLLGLTCSGKSSVGNAILGSSEFESRHLANSEKPVTMRCEMRCATVNGRQVAVVDTPDWFYSERPPEEVQRQLSLCESLSSPGPHVFLLCVSVLEQNNFNLQAVEALEKVFGQEAISKHTLVLFTHTHELSKDLALEEHLRTGREDLLQVVERCGDRYHVLQLEEDKKKESVEELLKIVEEMVKESKEEFYTYPPLPQIVGEEGGRDEIEECVGGNGEEDLSADIVRRRRGEEESPTEAEESGEKTEGSADGLEVEEDTTLSSPGPPPSFLRWVWNTVVDWVLWLPSMVRGSTLLGSLVGLFIGGVFGGAMGATVGSVATEVGRRKPQKTKTK